MKCEEIQSLHGAHLDSELDAKTALEIQQHLAACPDCERAFAVEAKLNAQVVMGLKRGQRTAALWDRIEQQVVATAAAESRSRQAPQVPPRLPWWRELLWPCPQAWAGLAAVWVVMLAVNFATPDETPPASARITKPSPQMRQILKEQKQMLAELGGVAEKLEAEHPGRVAPQPRSERRKPLMNT